MTENEIKNTKEWFEDFIETYALSNQETIEFKKAVACLEELQQCRAIGTIEEFKALKVENEELHCEIQAINATMELLENEIRAKAIDEFMEKVKPIIDEKIKGWTNSDDLRRWCARAVDEITEQMKAGGENES